MEPVVILGCGYTGQRLARRLSARGVSVIATNRKTFDATVSLDPLNEIPHGARVVYSIPILHPDQTERVVERLGSRPSRVVYLSTTGVYGNTAEVNESTPATPSNEEGYARIRAEEAISRGPWSWIILRPAAIYGPDRGVHHRMMQGTFRLGGDGSNFVSRIHVEDLAAHVDAALFSQLSGAWPVADEAPATSREVAEFCATMLKVAMPEAVPLDSLHHTRRANRKVDGRAIRKELGLRLQYPSYREGILASLAMTPTVVRKDQDG